MAQKVTYEQLKKLAGKKLFENDEIESSRFVKSFEAEYEKTLEF